ncbi:MAG: YihY/virulence factor BrkB family protein [Bacilli bacterium]|nr:YihY/virulence factor BrkB family protein [Bacilli bacterium]
MLKDYSKRIFDLIMKPEMKILPGQLAYFLILSIFPLLTLLGYIGTKITMLSSPFISIISKILPSSFNNILMPFLTNSTISGNATFVMILGFILVSNGTHSIIITSDELYGIDYGDYLKRRIKAFLMIFILIFLFMFVIIVLAYGNIIVNHIINLQILSRFKDNIYFAFVLIKWPFAFILFFWILKFMYTIAPDEEIPSKYMNKGALFTTISWIIITFGYSYYVTNFANYSLFYGSLSGIIIMMIWIYLLSFIFVMGIAINAEEYLAYKNTHKKQKINNNN